MVYFKLNHLESEDEIANMMLQVILWMLTFICEVQTPICELQVEMLTNLCSE